MEEFIKSTPLTPEDYSHRYYIFEQRCRETGIELTFLQCEVARDICFSLDRLPAGSGKSMLLELLKRFDV